MFPPPWTFWGTVLLNLAFQFLLGFFYYNEPFSFNKFVGFILIWIAVIIYLKDIYQTDNQGRNARHYAKKSKDLMQLLDDFETTRDNVGTYSTERSKTQVIETENELN